MSEQPRSRRQTRAAILGHLLRSGGMFRPPLAKAVRLSEASLSRILFDLKAEGLIEEVRRPAPYIGGPTGLVSLDNSVGLAAIELTGQRLSVGVGGLSGELHYAERLPLPETPTIESVGRVFFDALLPRLDAAPPGPTPDRCFGPRPWPVSELAIRSFPVRRGRSRHAWRDVCRRTGVDQFGCGACNVSSLPHGRLSGQGASVRFCRPRRCRRLDG